MILEQLSLANFRGFEQIDLAFDPRVTVVAGINGVGKLHVDDSQWRISGADAEAGTQVKVVAVDGATLKVERT